MLLVLNTFKARRRRQRRDLELSQKNQSALESEGGDRIKIDESVTSTPVDEEFAEEGSVHPLPAFLISYRKHVVLGLLFMFSVGIICTIILDISTGVPDS